MSAAILDDAGFGADRGYGKELYSGLLSEAYRLMGFRVVRVALGATATGGDKRVEGSRTPIVRAVMDKQVEARLVELLREMGVEVVHANILNPRYARPVAAAARTVDAKLVVTLHNWTPLCPTGWKTKPQGPSICNRRAPSLHCLSCISFLWRAYGKPLPGLVKGFYQLAALRGLAKHADIVVSPSKRFAEALKRETGLEAVHIPNPVPHSLLAVEPVKPRPGSAFFIGRLEPEKGVHLLPVIAKRIWPRRLHVAGRGSLQRLVEGDRLIVYHGYVSAEEKGRLFQGTSVFVFPAIWHEMYGYTVVEAFAYARPVVAFDIAGPGELVEASGGGVAVEPFNLEAFVEAVSSLIGDSGALEELGWKGREFVEKELGLDRFAERLGQVLKKV